MKVLVVNGPNLNMLGIREKSVYGVNTYEDLVRHIYSVCSENSLECEVFQSNSEGALIDKIQSAYGVFDGIIINAGGYSHTSIAIMDALKAVLMPCVEVHLSDISKREEFRRFTYTSLACIRSFVGGGFDSYTDAVKFLAEYFKNEA